MFTAIVYESRTGYTKRYAEILSKRYGVSSYSTKEAKNEIKMGSEVLFLGWVMGGKIKGLDRATKWYSLAGVCAVGMGKKSDKVINDIIKSNHLDNTKTFYLQGGFDTAKLTGVNKFMINMVETNLSKKDNISNDEQDILKYIREGSDFVDEKNVEEIIKYFEKEKVCI